MNINWRKIGKIFVTVQLIVSLVMVLVVMILVSSMGDDLDSYALSIGLAFLVLIGGSISAIASCLNLGLMVEMTEHLANLDPYSNTQSRGMQAQPGMGYAQPYPVNQPMHQPNVQQVTPPTNGQPYAAAGWKCPKCGAVNQNTSAYCVKCGSHR